jgi:divalent metal cation (Fe/Co/Zn/Cd) transporter
MSLTSIRAPGRGALSISDNALRAASARADGPQNCRPSSPRTLLGGHEPDPSPVGIGLATASPMIMLFLSLAQRRPGRNLGSNVFVAESTQTLLSTYLSAVLLAGLVLNATVAWAWRTRWPD